MSALPSRSGGTALTWNLGDFHPQAALVPADKLQPSGFDRGNLFRVDLVAARANIDIKNGNTSSQRFKGAGNKHAVATCIIGFNTGRESAVVQAGTVKTQLKFFFFFRRAKNTGGHKSVSHRCRWRSSTSSTPPYTRAEMETSPVEKRRRIVLRWPSRMVAPITAVPIHGR